MHRKQRRSQHSTLAGRVAGMLIAGTLLTLATPSFAQTAWVKDEVRLNLRAGPGVRFRILGGVKTGDSMSILERGDGWTKVRASDIGEGWIPEGYLQPQPPAGVRLAQSEAQTQEFREQFESLSGRATELESTNAELTSRDGTQRSTIEKLTRENLELRAGARWPEWITGAAILSVGMLLGIIVHSISGRRQRPRIRL